MNDFVLPPLPEASEFLFNELSQEEDRIKEQFKHLDNTADHALFQAVEKYAQTYAKYHVRAAVARIAKVVGEDNLGIRGAQVISQIIKAYPLTEIENS